MTGSNHSYEIFDKICVPIHRDIICDMVGAALWASLCKYAKVAVHL